MSPDLIAKILLAVSRANPNRCKSTINRRIMKLIEELGEVAEACLEVASLSNRKKKTWADVREETADVLIVAADIALTSLEEADDPQPRICHHVCNNLYPMSMGFHTIMTRLSQLNAFYSDTCHTDTPAAHQYAVELVRHAFALNESVKDRDKPEQLLAEVQRKIKKWKRKAN